MLLTGDYHTHTPYSHGKNTVDENAGQAKAIGLKEIAITDHGFRHVIYDLRRKDVPKLRQECINAQEKHGVKVLTGVEANILGPSGKTDFKVSDYDNFDIFLCGYHVLIFYQNLWRYLSYGMPNYFISVLFKSSTKAQIKRNTKAYVNAVKNNPIDVLTHVGFCSPADALEVAKCAADYGTYLELSSKKQHFTDEQLCDIVAKTSARFVINSDAHSADRVGDTVLIEKQLARVHFPMDRIDNIDGRTPTFRLAQLKNGK